MPQLFSAILFRDAFRYILGRMKETKRKVYLDNASTTPLDPTVFRAMKDIFALFGNAGSIHEEGVKAKKILEESRKKIALVLSARSDEIIFTSGGTESNNLAIFGAANSFLKKGLKMGDLHFITTAIEHSSVLNCFKELEGRGAEVSYVGVGENGLVNPKDVEKAILPNTVLVSVMRANNEIGTIEPIREISKCLKKKAHNFPAESGSFYQRAPIFHCDASQAACYLDLNTEKLGVDLLTIDGHKIYGPKGVGALFVRQRVLLSPIMFGGEQERGLRPGTENAPLSAALAKALEICGETREKETKRLAVLRDYCLSQILKRDQTVIVNGDLIKRLPNNINVSLPGVDTEFLVLQFDTRGISLSTKSACLEGDGGSYVVAALSSDKARSKSTFRISLGRWTTKKDIDYFLKNFELLLKNSLIPTVQS